MAAPSLAPTQSDIQTALRAFLIAILPTTVEVIQGEDNKVPEPQGPDFVSMTVLRRPRLGTNVDTLSSTGDQQSTKQPTMVVVQLDVHSNDILTASDNAQIISTLFRDEFATTFFADYPGITPLYADDPRQIPFINAESQYEPRYVVEAVLQADQVVTTAAQSADTVTVGLYNVDFPPS
jgi:hypothetical protein